LFSLCLREGDRACGACTLLTGSGLILIRILALRLRLRTRIPSRGSALDPPAGGACAAGGRVIARRSPRTPWQPSAGRGPLAALPRPSGVSDGPKGCRSALSPPAPPRCSRPARRGEGGPLLDLPRCSAFLRSNRARLAHARDEPAGKGQGAMGAPVRVGSYGRDPTRTGGRKAPREHKARRS